MPAGDVRAGEEPEATLRRLCAAARTVELIAQPGEVRVFAWMVKRSSGAGVRLCPRAPGGRRSAQEPRGNKDVSTVHICQPIYV